MHDDDYELGELSLLDRARLICRGLPGIKPLVLVRKLKITLKCAQGLYNAIMLENHHEARKLVRELENESDVKPLFKKQKVSKKFAMKHLKQKCPSKNCAFCLRRTWLAKKMGLVKDV